ncbi:molybdate ABC transporter substrate-binding protein [Actinoallomurus sp. NPDC052274]|uniref:molybdate ABC transporter substrate-binding protein n=1 Tax=Actinoallomurus sp. NPDC052274 TaxID=3155420 RepID=UPI003449F4D3
MIGHRTTLRTASIAVLAAALAAGCGDKGVKKDSGDKAATRTVVVFAAASLTESFTSLGKAFESSHPGVRVKFNFGGSSALAQQIDQGAPADVFAAASPATMKQVTDAGRASTPRVFARNRLEIAVPKGSSGKVTSLRDLTDPKVKVVLCAPQVPCGAAALKALAAAKLTVKPVSQEQDVKAALTKVRLNEADAALVYRTDVKAAAGQVQGIDFPEAAQAINDYPIAALTKAPQPGLAGEFVQSVLSPQGQATLQQAGFEQP